MSLFGAPTTSEGKRNDAAWQEILSAVTRLLTDERGTAGFEDRELYPGAGEIWRGRHALPIPHLHAVRVLRRAINEEERQALDNARGAGLTWEQIGEALGLAEAAQRADRTLTLAAWRYAAMRVLPRAPDPTGPGGTATARPRTGAAGPAPAWYTRAIRTTARTTPNRATSPAARGPR